jgi:hypothetical protein
MASPNKPDSNQPVDDDIYYDANSSPQQPRQPTPNEQDTPMAETAYPPLPPPPPAQPSNIPRVVPQELLDQVSTEELEAFLARRRGIQMVPATLPQSAVPQPAFPQPVSSQPVIPRQQPQVQPAQTQLMPTPNLGSGNAGPPNSKYTCPNCQRRGHPLRECPGPPDRFGYIPGCPKCHKLDHTLAQCPKGFTLQDVFHYIFSSRRNNFPMIWDTDLLDPEMGPFLNEAQPWTQGFAMQRMRAHLARDWDWHPEGTVPDPAWNLKDAKPPQIHPQAPAKVSRFTPAEMQEWKERRLETARRRNEVDRFSRPSGQHAGGRSSSGFPGPARNQPGGQRARGPDPLRRVDNNRRPRVGKPVKPSKPRATDNVVSKSVDTLGAQPSRTTTASIGGASMEPTERAQLGNRVYERRSPSPEEIVENPRRNRAASPQGSMLDNPRGNRAASPTASQCDPRSNRRPASPTASQYDPRRGRRAASPAASHYDPRGNRRAASPTRSQFDDPRDRRARSSASSQYDDPRRGRRSASPAATRFDDPRGGRRAASPQRSRHDDPRGGGGGSRDNTRTQSNRRRSSPHGRILDDRRANRAASPQASRLDLRGNNRAPSPQHSRYGRPRGGERSRNDTSSHSYSRRSSPHSPFLDDPRRTESEDCQNCKQPGHHHTRCPKNPRKTAPTRAATQTERSFDTRVNRLPVPADRRTRPEGLCFNCMNPNHAWRECPVPCTICGQKGHGRHHCTKRN